MFSIRIRRGARTEGKFSRRVQRQTLGYARTAFVDGDRLTMNATISLVPLPDMQLL